MPKLPLTKQLKNALAEIQRLKGELVIQQNHEGARRFAEGKVARLEIELARVRHELQEKEKAEAERTKLRPMSDAELMAVAATVLTEHGPKTEAQRRMATELERRGVVKPPESSWMEAMRRVAGGLYASVGAHRVTRGDVSDDAMAAPSGTP